MTADRATPHRASSDRPNLAPMEDLWLERLDLALDGELPPSEAAELEKELTANTELQAERRALEELQMAFSESRVEVHDGFAEQVMAALPVAPWQTQSRRAWHLPVAVLAALAASAVLVLGSAAGSGLLEGVAFGTGVAVLDFLAATAVAGLGLLSASWRGAGFALEELIAGSGLSLVGLAVGVLFINLLFFSLLRRPAHAAADASDDSTTS